MRAKLKPLRSQRQPLAGAAAFTLFVACSIARPAAAEYQAIQVENGGSIDGYVTFSDAPVASVLKVTKNQNACGTSIPDPSFTVNAAGRLANVIVYLKDIKKGNAGDTIPISLTTDNCMMYPRVQGAALGAPITMFSNDDILHNIHSQRAQTSATVFNVALPFRGVSVKKELPKESGLIKIKSDAQEWMHAWIMQFEHPYYSTTASDGHFSIKDIPPGTYTLVAWHEVMGERSMAVVIEAGHTAAPVFAFTESAQSARASTFSSLVPGQTSVSADVSVQPREGNALR